MGRSNNGVWQWVTMVTDKQVVAIKGQYNMNVFMKHNIVDSGRVSTS